MRELEKLLKDFNEKIKYNTFYLNETQINTIKRYAKRNAIASGHDNRNHFMLSIGRFIYILHFYSAYDGGFLIISRLWK